jgi:hypothetical protein
MTCIKAQSEAPGHHVAIRNFAREDRLWPRM